MSHKILVRIVIATFLTIIIMFLKKKDHQGITDIMSQTGPNVLFEII